MHDIDRTQAEYDDRFELEGPDSYETGGTDFEGDEEFEFEQVFDSEEAQIEELASELMQVQDEGELEAFLGKMLRRGLKKLGSRIPKGLPATLGGILKSSLRQIVPMASSAIGTGLGGPLGGLVSRKLANVATSALGLELEGLSPEDQEFETAKQAARFAQNAVQNAAKFVESSLKSGAGAAISGPLAAKKAVFKAAKQFAPGLVDAAEKLLKQGTRCHGGRWVRTPKGILLIGA